MIGELFHQARDLVTDKRPGPKGDLGIVYGLAATGAVIGGTMAVLDSIGDFSL